MEFYDTSPMFELLKAAFDGNQEARTQIQSIVAPYAITPDYSDMILVQKKHVVIYDTGRIDTLNIQPKQGAKSIQVADIYHCDENGVVWTSIPIPCNFCVSKMSYENGLFIFISDSNQQVGGTIPQIKKAMFEVAFAIEGVTEADIEKCFFMISSTVVECLQRRTLQQNPPIKDSVIGVLSFDERLQNYQALCNVAGKSFTLCIGLNERSKVMELLPKVRYKLDRIEEIDSIAKNFAAGELIDTKNNIWLEPHEKVMTNEKFIANMSVKHILCTPISGLELYYDDGGIFWGHSIVVCVNEQGQPQRAEIHG